MLMLMMLIFTCTSRRLENLSWRLWHLHSIMIDEGVDGPEERRQRKRFKLMTRGIGQGFDSEKGKELDELSIPELPPFKGVVSSRRSSAILRLKLAADEADRWWLGLVRYSFRRTSYWNERLLPSVGCLLGRREQRARWRACWEDGSLTRKSALPRLEHRVEHRYGHRQ
jgi:hypothetical protein